jgi:uncharacterized protein YkwD
MKQFLKKYFVPHDENDHHPYAFRWESMRNVVVLVLFFELATLLVPITSDFIEYSDTQSPTQFAAVLPSILANLTNTERKTQKLSPLLTNELLTKAAQMKADDMAQKGYFAHTSPEGITPWYWLDTVGYNYKYAGENLAINFTESSDVTTAWLNSPTHRANIIKDKYTEIGTGIATGLYEGRETIFVVQLYAQPVVSKINKNVVIVSKPSSTEKFNSLEYSK